MRVRRDAENLSVRAQRDLTGLLVRSAGQFGRARAEDTRDAILHRCRLIAAGQDLGHVRADVATRRPLRFWLVPPFLVVYDARTRLVVRILHGHRDVPAVLR